MFCFCFVFLTTSVGPIISKSTETIFAKFLGLYVNNPKLDF